MKKIHVFSFLCLIFFACGTSDNDIVSNNETDGLSSSLVPSLSSSSERIFSSSSEGSSSSSEREIPLCKTYSLIRDTTVYFNKQGGIDTIVTGMSIHFENFSESYGYLYFNQYEYLDQCEFFLTDYYTSWGENNSGNKVESDYCKNNYCYNDSDGIYSGSPHGVPVMKIECPWFSVTYIDEYFVQVLVKENETGKERGQSIPFTTGGCMRGTVDLKIIQTSTP